MLSLCLLVINLRTIFFPLFVLLFFSFRHAFPHRDIVMTDPVIFSPSSSSHRIASEFLLPWLLIYNSHGLLSICLVAFISFFFLFLLSSVSCIVRLVFLATPQVTPKKSLTYE